MAQDKITLFNLALQAVGVTILLSSPTESSPEAETCNLWYEPTRNAIMNGARWSSLTTVRRLSLLSQRDQDAQWSTPAPLPGYSFMYSAPVDMLRPWYMTDYSKFELYTGTGTRTICSNREDALLVYGRKLDQISLWDESLFMAIVYALAAHIAMPLTAKPNRAQVLLDRANLLVAEARVKSANENQAQLDFIPASHAARGIGALAQPNFFFPEGPFLTGGLNLD